MMLEMFADEDWQSINHKRHLMGKQLYWRTKDKKYRRIFI
jgi:hypothetical protein